MFAIFGLSLDLIGVIIMVWGLLKKDSKVGTYAHLDSAVERAEKTRKQTITGLRIIGVGFFLQIIQAFINL